MWIQLTHLIQFLKKIIIVGRNWKAFSSCDLSLMFKLIFKCFPEIKDKGGSWFTLALVPGKTGTCTQPLRTCTSSRARTVPTRRFVASSGSGWCGDVPDRPGATTLLEGRRRALRRGWRASFSTAERDVQRRHRERFPLPAVHLGWSLKCPLLAPD